MSELEKWPEAERQDLFGEIDAGFEVPAIVAEWAREYREEHGHFPHGGWNTETINLSGMAPRQTPLAGSDLVFLEPGIVSERLTRRIAAAKTVSGKTLIRTRYFGDKRSSSWAWVEVS